MMRPPKVAFLAPREESRTRNDTVSRVSGDSADFTRSDEGYFWPKRPSCVSTGFERATVLRRAAGSTLANLLKCVISLPS